MALRDAIYARLTAGHAGTATLIEDRCYPLVKPQDMKFACVVYQQISGTRWEVGGSDSGITFPVFQFRCIAPSDSETKALALQVVAALSRWSGTSATETILGTFDINQRDGFPEIGDNGKVTLYSVLVDARIWHAE